MAVFQDCLFKSHIGTFKVTQRGLGDHVYAFPNRGRGALSVRPGIRDLSLLWTFLTGLTNTQCLLAARSSFVALFSSTYADNLHPKMSASDSYIIQDAVPESSNDQDEVDSLPSSIDSSDLDSEEESDAQKEWEASLQQLELILTMVVVPYAGKYFGRKFAYWSLSLFHV